MANVIRILVGLAASALAAAFSTLPAAAQSYPARAVRFIVPFPPGGPSDVIARLAGEKAAATFGHPVVIENRPGAAGTAGVAFVSRAEPDGYTFGIAASSSLSIYPTMNEKPQYNPLTDLKLLSLLVAVPGLLVVNEKVPAKTLAELIALAKAAPGTLNYATPGAGTIAHLAVEMLKISTGIDARHVPYAGASPAINDLLGGHVQMLLLDLPILISHVKAGRMRPIAVASVARAPDLPGVPTARELGWHDVVADNWYALIAPPRTPEPIAELIHSAIVGALKSEEVRGKLEAQGSVIVASTPEAFAAHLKTEIAKFAKVIEAAKVKPK